MGKLIWVGVALYSIMCYYHIVNAETKLSIHYLLLMLPQWCEMTDLTGNRSFELSPEDTTTYAAATVILLVLCWYLTELDDVELTNVESSKLNNEVSTVEAEDEMRNDVIWDSAKCLMDQVDLECELCKAFLASNNETPGKIVGGEAEWASGKYIIWKYLT